MPLIKHFVSPKLPTTLENDTHVDIPGHDATYLHIDQVHIIPIQLNVAKFLDALSRLLQLYPHAAGRLRCTDGIWSIELTNTPVPVDVDQSPDSGSNLLLSGDWVVQDNITPLVNQHPLGAGLVNCDAPLLRFKLTILDDGCCIGVSWSHALGDAIWLSRFFYTLSQFYQDLPSEFASPTFKKNHFLTPSPSVIAELSSRMILDRILDLDEAVSLSPLKHAEHVRWHVDIHDLETLRSALSCNGQNKKYISKQDCLTAYLVAVLNSSRRTPMPRVSNTCSYRHIKAPFVDENLAGNLLMMVSASVPSDMAGIASAVRDALVQSRDPDCLYNLESLKSAYMLKVANAGRMFPFQSDEDDLIVNSNVVIDWERAHFGYSGAGIRFHTSGFQLSLVRCFKSNPVKGDDGAWQARRSIEISMGVSAEAKPKIMEMLGRGVHHMLADKGVPL